MNLTENQASDPEDQGHLIFLRIPTSLRKELVFQLEEIFKAPERIAWKLKL
jgi:hypothetical protein